MLTVHQVIVGVSRALVASFPGWAAPVPCILPQSMGLPDNLDGRFGLGTSYTGFNVDSLAQATGAQRFEDACTNAARSDYRGIIIVDHEANIPNRGGLASDPSGWFAYQENALGVGWIQRRIYRLQQRFPFATIVPFNHLEGGLLGRGCLCAYVPNGLDATKEALAYAETYARAWTISSPIISGWPEGIPTAPLDDEPFDAMMEWSCQYAATRGGGRLLVWNQAEDPRQAQMSLETNQRIEKWRRTKGGGVY